ncbi:hypothetical protein DFQ27_001336, partial [Actinomortierella ambigua]
MIMFADSVIFDPDAPIFRNQPLPTPTPQHFLEGLQTESQKETTQFHIFDALRRHGCDSGDWIPTLTDIDRLPAQKTETYSLPGLPHGQSTLEGVLAGLEEIVEHSGLSKEHISNRNIIFAGDMFTVDRLRTLKRLRSLDVSPYTRLEWVFPVFQLFHLQITLVNVILRTHWGSQSVPGSLCHLVTALGRKRINNKDKSDFHSAEQFLQHTFDATVLLLWMKQCASRDKGDLNDAVSKDERSMEDGDQATESAESSNGDQATESAESG